MRCYFLLQSLVFLRGDFDTWRWRCHIKRQFRAFKRGCLCELFTSNFTVREVRTAQVCSAQVRSAQIRPEQATTMKVCLYQLRLAQVSSDKVSLE